MSVGFLNKFYTKIAGAITAAAVIITIPDTEYRSLLELDQDYVHALLRDKTNREVVIIDVAASTYSGLSVLRGQESTVARAWPRGSTIAQVVTADNYEDFLQVGSERSVGYDPNGVVAPEYFGEKVLQLTDSDVSTRWYISQNATDKLWIPLTGITYPGSGPKADPEYPAGTTPAGYEPGIIFCFDMEDSAAVNGLTIYSSVPRRIYVAEYNVWITLSKKDMQCVWSGGDVVGPATISTDIYKTGTSSLKHDNPMTLNTPLVTASNTDETHKTDYVYPVTAFNVYYDSFTITSWIYIPATFAADSFNDFFCAITGFSTQGSANLERTITYSIYNSAGIGLIYDNNGVTGKFAPFMWFNSSAGCEFVNASWPAPLVKYRGTTFPVSKGAWTHVAGVFDAYLGTMSLYVDGVILGSAVDMASVWTSFYDEDGLSFGINTRTDNHASSGAVDNDAYYDDVRYYNYALTTAEILALPGF